MSYSVREDYLEKIFQLTFSNMSRSLLGKKRKGNDSECGKLVNKKGGRRKHIGREIARDKEVGSRKLYRSLYPM